MTNVTSNAKLILFCGPSGSGKTSIVRYLLKKFPQLSFSISATTRAKRNGEVHGKDYYFISVDEFHERIKNDEFLEWEEVYLNGFYGTLRSEVNRIAELGKVAIFDVDVEGGIHIKGRFGDNLLDVFVRTPTLDDLRKRLMARASETPDSLDKRVQKAAVEITYSDRFTNVIINKELDSAFNEAEVLVTKFLTEKNNLY